MVDAHDNETYTAQDSRLIWIDCEMTGLDIFHDELVEISVVPTDFDLNVLDEGIDYVIKPSQAAVDQMNDFVRRMHTHSGLINEWEHGLDVSEAEANVIEYVRRFTPKGVRPLLAGNSVGSDKKFLDRYMPGLMEHLHYRVIDVSTIKELSRRWYPAVYNHKPAKHGSDKKFLDRYMPGLMEHLHYRVIDVSTIKELSRRWYPAVYNHKPAKHGGHRALADIIESIDELRYYRDLLFVPAPGPDDRAAADAAARIEQTSLLRTYERNGSPLGE